MQTVRIIQAVILMSLLALAASCTVSRDFANRVFKPAVPDSTTKKIRFLELENTPPSDSGRVSTEAFRDSLLISSEPPGVPREKQIDSIRRPEPLTTPKTASGPAPVLPDSRGVRQKRTRNQ